jgi:hypothetical protein
VRWVSCMIRREKAIGEQPKDSFKPSSSNWKVDSDSNFGNWLSALVLTLDSHV